jgi:hypothetical protein
MKMAETGFFRPGKVAILEVTWYDRAESTRQISTREESIMESPEITTRDSRLIEHLQTAWQAFQKLAPQQVADIAKFILGLEEPYQHTALNMIAKHMVSTMNLHIFLLMTVFQNNAEQDDILPEDCKETLDLVLSGNIHVFGKLDKYILIRSFDDLVKLGYVTGSLESFSRTTSAEMARNWIYKLADMYYTRMKREDMLARDVIDGTSNEGEVTSTQPPAIQASIPRKVMESPEITTRDSRLIEHLQTSWQSLQEPTSQQVAETSKFILGLEEPYQHTALNMIAKYIVSVISLHMLSLTATFQKNAEREDILPEDCKETLEQVLPKTFRILDDLSKYISVQSLGQSHIIRWLSTEQQPNLCSISDASTIYCGCTGLDNLSNLMHSPF